MLFRSETGDDSLRSAVQPVVYTASIADSATEFAAWSAARYTVHPTELAISAAQSAALYAADAVYTAWASGPYAAWFAGRTVTRPASRSAAVQKQMEKFNCLIYKEFNL